MLTRLPPPPLVRGDNNHRRGHRPDSGEHVAEKALMPWYVDEGDGRPGGQGGPGVPEVDGHPPPAFLGPPVGFHAGERPDQRRLAVIDVPSRRDHVHGLSLTAASTAAASA